MNLRQQLNDYIEQREHIAHNMGVKNVDNFTDYLEQLEGGLQFSNEKIETLIEEFITVSDEIARIEREIAG